VFPFAVHATSKRPDGESGQDASDRRLAIAILFTEEAMQAPSRKEESGVEEMESTYRAPWSEGP